MCHANSPYIHRVCGIWMRLLRLRYDFKRTFFFLENKKRNSQRDKIYIICINQCENFNAQAHMPLLFEYMVWHVADITSIHALFRGFDFMKRMFDISIWMLDIEFLLLDKFTRAAEGKKSLQLISSLFFSVNCLIFSNNWCAYCS